MDVNTKKRLELLRRVALSDLYGDAEVAISPGTISAGMPSAVFTVEQFYGSLTTDRADLYQLLDIIVQGLILAYREAKGIDPAISTALLNSMIQDFPGVPDSRVTSCMQTLMQAASQFKEAVSGGNDTAIREHLLVVIESYNDFLNALLGFLLTCIRASQNQHPPGLAFAQNYADRVKEMYWLTGGENGAYSVLLRTAKPDLHDAISQGAIWIDDGDKTVGYSKNSAEHKLSWTDTLLLATIGSHIPHAYVTAMAVITVFECGDDAYISRMPEHLVRVFHDVPNA